MHNSGRGDNRTNSGEVPGGMPAPGFSSPTEPHLEDHTEKPSKNIHSTGDRYPSPGFPLANVATRSGSQFFLRLLMYPTILAIIAFGLKQYVPQVPINVLCVIPGLCESTRNPRLPMWADFPRLGKAQTDTFNSLIESGLGGYKLVGFVTKAEMAANDLVTAVRVSDLKSRDLLANKLSEFASDAAETGDELQGLHAEITGTANNIFVINEYALRTIEGAVLEDKKKGLAPSSRPAAEAAVLQSFAEVLHVQSVELEGLVGKATDILGHLRGLKESLKVIHGIIYRENRDFTADEAKLLSTLWSQLGGNIQDKRMFKNNLSLLERLATYHHEATHQVQGALLVLNQMRLQMQGLRKNVAAPAVGGLKIPLEVQMKSIQSSMDRLQDSLHVAKTKAKREIEGVRSGK